MSDQASNLGARKIQSENVSNNASPNRSPNTSQRSRKGIGQDQFNEKFQGKYLSSLDK